MAPRAARPVPNGRCRVAFALSISGFCGITSWSAGSISPDPPVRKRDFGDRNMERRPCGPDLLNQASAGPTARSRRSKCWFDAFSFAGPVSRFADDAPARKTDLDRFHHARPCRADPARPRRGESRSSDPDPDPGDPAGGRGARPHRHRPDRHRQDRRLRLADPPPARRPSRPRPTRQGRGARAGAGADPRAGEPDRRPP